MGNAPKTMDEILCLLECKFSRIRYYGYPRTCPSAVWLMVGALTVFALAVWFRGSRATGLLCPGSLGLQVFVGLGVGVSG